MPAAFEHAVPAAEALAIAAEQLWARKDKRIPGTITELIAHASPAPVHPHAAMQTVSLPAGLVGVRLRASRQWQRIRKTFAALQEGRLRPHNIAENVDLFRKRERLFTILENDAKQDGP
jgi:hypothetical protein